MKQMQYSFLFYSKFLHYGIFLRLNLFTLCINAAATKIRILIWKRPAGHEASHPEIPSHWSCKRVWPCFYIWTVAVTGSDKFPTAGTSSNSTPRPIYTQKVILREDAGTRTGAQDTELDEYSWPLRLWRMQQTHISVKATKVKKTKYSWDYTCDTENRKQLQNICFLLQEDRL